MCGDFTDGSEPEGSAEAEEWNESGSSTETETHGTELFWLDYQADSGSITSVLVHKVNAPSFKQCFWSIFLPIRFNFIMLSLFL